jgi:uncharacterized repeat protein (TIGR03803 family)
MTVPRRNVVTEIGPRAAIVALAFMFGLLTAIGASSAQAQTYKVLYAFKGNNAGNNPYPGVVADAAGNLYGTTYSGGKGECYMGAEFGCGTVYKVDPTGRHTVIFSFDLNGNGKSGFAPVAGLTPDGAGNFYGTSTDGLSSNVGDPPYGTVYEIDKAGKHTVIYTFKGGATGSYPIGPLVRDAAGNLYGTTYVGGTGKCKDYKGNLIGCGTVFKVDPTGKHTVLYSFAGWKDGARPYNVGLLRDASGNLYGTTSDLCLGNVECPGVTGYYGTVFKLDATGKETVLHHFNTSGSGTDGANPVAGLIMDAKGNLYGTTLFGGDINCGGGLCGTVFKVDPTGKHTVLYAFTGGKDQQGPGGLIRDGAGNLYGTTIGYQLNGSNQFGTVFKLSKTGQLTVLYSFTGGADGGIPGEETLLRDASGTLYGTTYYGGDAAGCPSNGGQFDGCGVVFKITP